MFQPEAQPINIYETSISLRHCASPLAVRAFSAWTLQFSRKDSCKQIIATGLSAVGISSGCYGNLAVDSHLVWGERD